MFKLLISIVSASLCLLSTFTFANNVPPNFPNPENVRVESGVLKWNEVDNAGGYNVYFTAEIGESAAPLTYIETIKGATEFQLESNGTYSVVSFNADATLFSNQFSPDVRVVFEGGTNFNEPVQLFSVTCGNVQLGESCVASCPGSTNANSSFYATGGACSTSDSVEVGASGDLSSYSCTVLTASREVRAQVYCLNYNLFNQ